MKQCRILNYVEPRLFYLQGEELSLYKWRKEVLKRDKNRCQHCFDSIKDVFRSRKFSHEAHHIIARTHGGKNTLNNGVTLCKFCHPYFDMMYLAYGFDYFEVINKKPIEKRLKEVRSLMKKRFINHLRKIILYSRCI